MVKNHKQSPLASTVKQLTLASAIERKKSRRPSSRNKGAESDDAPRLPKEFAWFDIKNYSRARTFGPAEWAIELGYRRNIRDSINAHNFDACHEAFLNIHKNGLITPATRIDKGGRPLDKKLRTHDRGSTVSALLVRDVFKLASNAIERKELCDRYEHFDVITAGAIAKLPGIAEIVEKIEQGYDDFSKNKYPEDWHGYAHAVIDLEAPEDTILRDFQAWIKAHKEALDFKMPWERFSKKQQFKSWINNGVLPFIDLTHWARVVSIAITYKTIGSEIFSDPDLDTSVKRIEIHTRPLSEKVLNRNVIQSLTQAA